MPKFLKEPLFHFALIGAALFGLYAVIGSPVETAETQQDRRIVIDDRLVERLSQGFEGVWRRVPTDAEIEGLIETHVVEEVLVREALLLGLDVGDSVVRQRLRLKMDFLLEGGVSALEPSDEELAVYMAENQDRFARPALIGFSQVYMGEDATEDEVLALTSALNEGGDPGAVGERSLLPPQLPPSPQQSIDGTFGVGVFDALEPLPLDVWSGPVRSGYGLHIVRVDARRPSELPEIDTVRDAVERTWRTDKALELRDARIETLLGTYEVERTDQEES